MSETEVIPKNIVLIGFMGSGKSTVGRELHQRLGYSLVDMDQMIEEAAGKKITAIFEEDGEQAFRDLETRHLEKISKQTERRHIISTGGGVIIREGNRELLRKLGYVVWLQAPEDIIYERTSRNADRPLLNQPDAREKISKLLAERAPWYAETAHLKLDIRGLDSKEIATGILECARYFFTHPA
jgi:shikimate kinase